VKPLFLGRLLQIELKDLDKEIVVNSMDVQWQNIMIDFVKLLKPLDANVR
jgi:hypothetical protein